MPRMNAPSTPSGIASPPSSAVLIAPLNSPSKDGWTDGRTDGRRESRSRPPCYARGIDRISPDPYLARRSSSSPSPSMYEEDVSVLLA